MSRAAHLFLVMGVIAAMLFAVLIVISLGWLSPQGLSNFDARFLGYDAADARAYLAILQDADRALYLGAFHGLDTVFPILAAFAIGGGIWLNLGEKHVIRRIAIVGLPLAYLMMDLAENTYVAQILRSDGPISEQLVNLASNMTQLKWVFLVLSIVFLVVHWHRAKGEVF